jgi:hypothetical protein
VRLRSEKWSPLVQPPSTLGRRTKIPLEICTPMFYIRSTEKNASIERRGACRVRGLIVSPITPAQFKSSCVYTRDVRVDGIFRAIPPM